MDSWQSLDSLLAGTHLREAADWRDDTAVSLGLQLAQIGRHNFMTAMEARGLSLDQRVVLVEALVEAQKRGLLPTEGGLSQAFSDAADKMPPIARHLLVENGDPAEVEAAALLNELGRNDAKWLGDATIMDVPCALSAKACATLRAAVDAQRGLASDSVDGGAEHQLNLSRQALEMLVGAEPASRLWTLPAEYRARSALVPAPLPATGDAAAAASSAAVLRREAVQCKRRGDLAGALEKLARCRELEAEAESRVARSGAEADEADSTLELREMFVRRYTVDTRPWIAFHPDAYEVTVNVALSDDDEHGGGSLLGVHGGAVRRLTRREGDATVHSSRLLHGVSAMTHGTRHSLILFFDRRARAGQRNRWTDETDRD
jgi:hypothetical protein